MVDIGILGAGAIVRTMHLPVLLSMREVRVAWVADADPRAAAALARAFRVPAHPHPAAPGALPSARAVLVAIPVGAREPYLRAMASRGIAAFVEKPFARDLEEHDRLAAPFPPAQIACGLQRRTFETARFLRGAVTSGAFGALSRIRVREGGRLTRTLAGATFLDDRRAGGGALLELGCHVLDFVLHVTGATGVEVRSSEIVWDGPVDRRVAARLDLDTPAGRVPLEVTVSWLDAQENRAYWEFDGVTLASGSFAGAPLEILSPAGKVIGVVRSEAGGATTTNQAFYLEWRAFLDGLLSGEPSEMSALSVRTTTAAMEAIYEAGSRR